MTKASDFTDIERAAMEAVRFFVRDMGGAAAFAETFGVNRRTAYRIVGMQQPPPVGVAQQMLETATAWFEYAAHGDKEIAPHSAAHIAALRAFIQQRTTPKGGVHG